MGRCLLESSKWKFAMLLDPVSGPLSSKWLLILMDTGVSASQMRTYEEPVMALNPGPRLNIKTVLSTYGDSHVKDKMS